MNFYKVSVCENGSTHVAKDADIYTLCGREWFFANDQGGNSYCRTCQYILANHERLLIKRVPSRYARAKKRSDAALRKLEKALGL